MASAYIYGRRPSLWIEPIGDWGAGAVDLVEIPTTSEYNDNIVAFWRPREKLRAGGEYSFTYRMHWGVEDAPDPGLARIVEVRAGAGTAPGTRVFVLDLIGLAAGSLPAGVKAEAEVGCSAGRLVAGYSGPNPETGGWRVSLDFDPAGAASAELRCVLRAGPAALSETWLHRWVA